MRSVGTMLRPPKFDPSAKDVCPGNRVGGAVVERPSAVKSGRWQPPREPAGRCMIENVNSYSRGEQRVRVHCAERW